MFAGWEGRPCPRWPTISLDQISMGQRGQGRPSNLQIFMSISVVLKMSRIVQGGHSDKAIAPQFETTDPTIRG
jgi:hypothetical protein